MTSSNRVPARMKPSPHPPRTGRAWVAVSVLVMAAGAVAASCARPMAPSGGPRDVIPPMILTTWPEPFEVIEPTREPVKITFNERISERPTQGTLEQAVVVSPVTGEHQVKKTRSGLEVEVIGGFKPDLVYRVRILPTVKDMFSNTMEGPFELVFSTGADYEENVVAGVVVDRLTGDPVAEARVEARATGIDDPPIHVAKTDSAGVFALRYLPSGPYQLDLYQDNNRNQTPDFRELQGVWGPIPLGLEEGDADTVLVREVALLRPDTIPARLIGVEAQDSVTIRLAFDDFLDAEGSLDPIEVVIAEEDGLILTVDRLLWPRELDSIRAVADSIAMVERAQAERDSLRAVADSLTQVMAAMEAAADTMGIDTLGPVLARIENRLAPPEEPEEEVPEEGRREAPAPPPILPQQEVFVIVADSIPGNRLFQVTVSGVVNINGVADGGGEASFTWEPPEPPEEEADTTAVPPDTAAVPADTAAVAPDTTVIRPDTIPRLRRPGPDHVRPSTFLPGRRRLDSP